MVFLLFLNGDLMPYQKEEPNSGVGRILKEYIDPSTPETAFLKDVVNKSAKAIGRTISNNKKVKGGAPEFEDSETPGKRKYKNKGDGNGRRNSGNNGDGKRYGKASQRPSSGNANSSDTTRGYKTNPGSGCILFSSGISSGLTVNTRIVTENYTPIYLSSGNLFIITDPNIDLNTEFDNQLKNVIYPNVESVISNRIQRYAGRYITSNDYSKYMYSIINALQVYYCIDNVLTYRSNTIRDNINVGMDYLSSKFSSEAIVEFTLLRDYLCTCVCPPNLLNYIRFMCQSYKTSDAPHASIIKLNIGGMFDEEWSTPSFNMVNMIKNCRINLINNNTMVSYLYQAYPNWLISSPPESSNVACYNVDFLTFWHNQNCTYQSTDSKNKGNFEYSIKVPSMDFYTDYQIIQRDVDVDGLMFVSQTYNVPFEADKPKLASFWGIWQPLASVENKDILPGRPFDTFNIKCFTTQSKIQAVTDYITLGSSGIYNLVVYNGNAGKYIAQDSKFGTKGFVKLQNVSVRMQTEAFNESIRYLLT